MAYETCHNFYFTTCFYRQFNQTPNQTPESSDVSSPKESLSKDLEEPEQQPVLDSDRNNISNRSSVKSKSKKLFGFGRLNNSEKHSQNNRKASKSRINKS